MSAPSTNHFAAPQLQALGLLRRTLNAIGAGLTAFMLARQRMSEFQELSAMTDAELRKRGISREGIAAFVFRDQQI